MSRATTSPMPRSAGLSAFLHFSVFGLLIFFGWWSQRADEAPPAQFELVAGPGDNYAATAAPTTTAEITPTVTLTIPEPTPRPVVQSAPPPRPLPPPPPEPKVIERKPAPVVIEKAPEKPPVKIEPAREQVSFDDFAKERGAPKPAPVRKAPPPINPTKINLDRVMSATNVITTGAGGTAMTSTELSMSKRYVAMIIQRIRESLEQAGINDLREAGVRFSVSVEGAISDASITRSSGNAAFDRAVLAAFRNIRPIGSPPTGRAEVFTTVIRLTEG